MAVSNAQILAFLDSHPISHYPDDFNSIIHMLCNMYLECNPIDNAHTKAIFSTVDSILQQLSLQDHERIFSVITDLCLEYEKESFTHGLTVGVRLMHELIALS